MTLERRWRVSAHITDADGRSWGSERTFDAQDDAEGHYVAVTTSALERGARRGLVVISWRDFWVDDKARSSPRGQWTDERTWQTQVPESA